MDFEALFARVLHLNRHKERRIHQDPGRGNELFPTAPTAGLPQGVYDGDTTFGELAEHGDFGLGTFNALDGEMVTFDGVSYQITADGRAHGAPLETRTPFAVVLHFRSEQWHVLADPLDLPGCQHWLDGQVASKNAIYAVKAVGSFAYVKTRSVPGRRRPTGPSPRS